MLAFLSLLLVPVALARNITLAGPPTVLPRGGSSRFTNYYAGDSECVTSCLLKTDAPFNC